MEQACGNGQLDTGEACDDGNRIAGDGCSPFCRPEDEPSECGNGILEGTEECDDANIAGGDGCSATCTLEERPSLCGNNILERDEECDDGNRVDGDGCDATCQIETVSEPECGNGVEEAGEDCDDGNTTSGDGCSSECLTERPESVCGNGEVERGEACDDGNTTSGDGCSSACSREDPEGSVFDSGHPLHSHLSRASSPAPGSDTDEFGSFRMRCALSHLNYDDAIVFPGMEGNSHLHTYFGNIDLDFSTTIENVNVGRGSTCQGDQLNMSGYWVPTVLRPEYEQNADGSYRRDGSGQPIPTGGYVVVHPLNSWWLDDNGVPMRDGSGALMSTGNYGTDIYYKRAYSIREPVAAMPLGLRMIAGNASATPRSPQHPTITEWSCHDERGGGSPTIPTCNIGPTFPDIPWRVHMTVLFPPCWDGMNLDSPDHKSHMSYPEYVESGNFFRCPATHPVLLPQVSYQIYYPVMPETTGPTGDTSDWFLSSDTYPSDIGAGGASAHGDWYMAWHPEVIDTFTEHCINQERHCSHGDLGNGFRLHTEIPGEGAAGLSIRASR